MIEVVSHDRTRVSRDRNKVSHDRTRMPRDRNRVSHDETRANGAEEDERKKQLYVKTKKDVILRKHK